MGGVRVRKALTWAKQEVSEGKVVDLFGTHRERGPWPRCFAAVFSLRAFYVPFVSTLRSSHSPS